MFREGGDPTASRGPYPPTGRRQRCTDGRAESTAGHAGPLEVEALLAALRPAPGCRDHPHRHL